MAVIETQGFKLDNSGRRIVVDPVTRIEGHLRVEVNLDDKNVIRNAVSTGTMWRGLEVILKGRDPRDAWAFTERICGVCTGTHALTSVRAVEDALGIQIPENAQSVTVGEDGQVSVQLKGDGQSQVVGQINTTDFVNPTGLQPMGENLFLETQSSGAPIQGTAGADGLGVIKQGMLETSNVNVTEELVNLIQAQRVYEMNSKVISAVDSMMSFLTQRT